MSTILITKQKKGNQIQTQTGFVKNRFLKQQKSSIPKWVKPKVVSWILSDKGDES